MNKLQKKRYFKIKETAQLLGVSTKTLRRWDLSGRLKPKRTVKNNYRYYTYSQIEKILTSLGNKVEKTLVLNSKPRVIRKIARTSPEIQELIVGMDRISRKPKRSSGLLSFFSDRLYKLTNPSRLPFPHLGFSKRQKKIILASAITTFSSIYTAQSLKAASTPTYMDVSPSVLGISDEALEFNFKVNVPAIFEDTTFNGTAIFNNIATFKQSLVAPNILYSLSATDDSGIQIEGIQNLIVTNTDKGSDQLFFSTVSVSGQSDVVSDTNSDTFTFAAGTGISLSTSADDDKLTITNTSLNESGWIDGGTVIYNETLTSKVGIGTITPASLLEVVGTVQLKGSSSTIGMYVNSSGYVGIGTTSPSNYLTIDSGTGDVSGLTFSQLTSGSDAGVGGGKVLSLDSGGKIILVNDQTGGGSAEDILPSATSGSTLYFNGTNWASSTNLFHNGGSVGISTDAPAGRLEVETNDAATIGLIIQGYTSQTSNLQEWHNMAGSTLSYIDASGVFNGTISAGGGSIDPGLTLGSVLFQGASAIDHDNNNFFWDNTDKFLKLPEIHLTGIASTTSTTAGSMYYDSDDNQLKLYTGSKWQADRSSATLIVAANDSQNKEKADYVANGTDDDVTIETAIAALPAGGGKITLLEGTFSIGDTAGDGVDITKSNVTLEGQGKSTILQRAGTTASDDGIITIGDGGTTSVSGIFISNISFDGQKITYNSSRNNNIKIYTAVSDSTISNNWFSNLADGADHIYSTFNQRVTINNNYFDISSSSNGYAIVVDRGGQDFTISNNTINDGGGIAYGISVKASGAERGEYISVINNKINYPETGIFIDRTNYAIVSGNIISNADHTGIIATYTTNSIINENNIQNPRYYGIRLSSSSTNNAISGNHIYEADVNIYSAINLQSTSDNNLISDNEISGGGYSTEIGDSASGNTIQQRDQFHLDPMADAYTTNEGDIFYDSDDDKLKVYNGTAWNNLNEDGKSSTIVVAASNSLDTSKADYVASGTDDDVTIESAIAALPAGGGKVVLLEGTFSIGDTAGDGVDITKSNVTIEGQGDATILQRQANTAAVDGIITIGDGGTTIVSGIAITNLAVDGQKPTYTSTLNAGIFLNKEVTYSTIENIYIENNSGYGIYSLGAAGDINEYIDIINNNFLGNGTYSGKPSIDTSYTDNTTIANNTIPSSNFTGITIGNSTNNRVINNTVYKTLNVSYSTNSAISNNNIIGVAGQYSLYSTQNPGSVYNIITGNIAYDGAGAYITGDNNTFSTNIITTSNSRGLYIADHYNTVSDNSITVSGNNDGIQLGGNADNNIVTSNNIYGPSGNKYGINISASTEDNNYIASNEIYGGGWTAEIVDAGTGTTIQSRDQFQLNADGEIALDISGSAIGQALVQLDELGDQAIFTASSSGVLQFIIANDGNVGLGVVEPSHKLEVEGAVIGQALMSLNETGDQDIFTASASGTTRFVVANDGNVGIGTAAPAYALDVLASGAGIIARFSSDNSSGCTLADGGTISCTSDERLKTNIVSLGESIIGQVMNLRAVEYDWKSGPGEYKHLGFLAQEVGSIFPSLVSTDEATGYKQLNTISMVPLLTKALQEQQHQIETLKLEVTDQGEIISNSTYLKQLSSDVDSLRIDQDNLVSSVLGIKDEVSSTAGNTAEIREDVDGVKDQLTQITDLVNMLSADATQSAEFTLAQSIESDLSFTTIEGLDTSKTATFSSILVSGDTVLNNLGITGSLTTGTLLMDGLTNTIKSVGFEPLMIQPSTLTGIEFMGGKISMDVRGNLILSSGVIKGNDTFRGQVSLDANITSIHVDQSWSEAPTSIQTTPTFDTRTWITDINQNGFTIHTSTTSENDQQIHWLAIW